MTSTKTSAKKNRVHINAERCKGCGLCVAFCPRNILEQAGETNSKGYRLVSVSDISKCTGCNMCSMFCPEFAIWVETEKDKS